MRGVKNGAAIHAIASAFVPIYGLIYFFAAEKRPSEDGHEAEHLSVQEAAR
jgi:hypothetical protein